MNNKKDNNIERLSKHRNYNGTLTKKQFLSEIYRVLEENGFSDFIFITVGADGHLTRIGSKNPEEMRYGDALYLLEIAKDDIIRSM